MKNIASEMKQISLGTLYDLNKQIILNKTEPISSQELQNIQNNILNWFNHIQKYAMLLCRERYDFTVFHLTSPSSKTVIQDLFEVLNNRGTILSIEKDETENNNAWEIWIKIDNTAYVYYLFDCYDFIIEC